jgi:hypothetical protein
MTGPDAFDSAPIDQLADLASGSAAQQTAAELLFLRLLMRMWPASRRRSSAAPTDATE